jgi:hypothetical protein
MALARQDWLEQLLGELGYTGFVTPSDNRLPGLLE